MSFVTNSFILGSRAIEELDYTGIGYYNPGGTFTGPRTLSSVPVGAADDGRTVIVALFYQSSGTTEPPVTGVTIGGVSATRIGDIGESGNPNEHYVEFWKAPLPSGTAADVVVTFTGSLFRVGVMSYRVIGYSSVFDSSAVGTLSEISLSTTVNVRAGGAVIGAVFNNGSATFTWAGVTEDEDSAPDNARSSASDMFASDEADRTISVTQSTNASPQAMSVISL
ncbi:hypothetical protein [Thalassospira lohafexi]|uniref:Uncharacterized protein n=1 Tax=Thalassospira lohafexi TaxID=744227 RepID=A0A2N3L3V0_9PROT|nr:hypothetical protein [Thalassospira lohafexi]PKR57513.1 hypothetical protein COO92_16360 [Thalassospira lohafexi]